MAITDWPEAERPREKLLTHGAQALSDAELLAIFLRTGVAGKSAVDVARDLIQHFGGLRALLAASSNEFCQAKGLGKAKYAQLQAVTEMAKRHLFERLQTTGSLTNSEASREFLRAKLRDQPSEVFACVFLSAQHAVLAYEELFYGTIDGASVYPREVVRKALKHNAAAVIFAHNHPSGVAEPSQSDQRITQRLQEALSLVDVRVLDHVIVGDCEVVSMADRGVL